jgi:hypothetical protein
VLDGVTFAIRDCRDALAATGTTIESLIAVGGGSRSDYWLASIATALGVPVQVPVAGDFGGAFGAARLAIMAATGAGAEIATAPETDRVIDPDPPFPRPTTRPMPASAPPNPPSGTDMTDFFAGIEPIRFEGPDSDNDFAFRHYDPDEVCWASGWRITCALPSPTGTASPGPAATRSAARPSSARGSATASSWRR